MTFAERYGAAFAAYAQAPGEDALAAAYELGREAVREDLSVLDLAAIHNDALDDRLAGSDDPRGVVRVGGAFFLEALSAYEMLRRILQDARKQAEAEQRQTAVLRRLSAFLADASIAADATDGLGEVVQLVAEHARELLDTEACRVRVASGEGEAPLEATAGDPEGGWIATELTALDGRPIGLVQVFGGAADFTALDEALLAQLAQMASAALERARLYAT